MKMVYLVIRIIEFGFATGEKPVRVYKNKFEAEKVAERIWGYVQEIEYVDE